jgi:uncharacterized protein (TIGR03437 family)
VLIVLAGLLSITLTPPSLAISSKASIGNANLQFPPMFLCNNPTTFIPIVAPGSIVSGGSLASLSDTTESATTIPLPTTLAQRQVKVIDSASSTHYAPLFSVSPTQIVYQLPAGTALGSASVSVIGPGNTIIASGGVQVVNVAPGLFTVGGGNPATADGVWLRYSGGQLVAIGSLQTTVQFGNPGDIVYFVLYGTGIRNRSSLSAVSVTVGGTSAIVDFAGPVGTLVGQDQINAVIPGSLAGAGQVNLILTVDGITAPTVKVTV